MIGFGLLVRARLAALMIVELLPMRRGPYTSRVEPVRIALRMRASSSSRLAQWYPLTCSPMRKGLSVEAAIHSLPMLTHLYDSHFLVNLIRLYSGTLVVLCLL